MKSNSFLNDDLHASRSVITVTGASVSAVSVSSDDVTPAEQSIASFFNALHDSIPTELPFNANWGNGTGYFDGLQRSQEVRSLIPLAGFAKSLDNNGRKIVVGNTQLGLIVLFERYNDSPGVVVGHYPIEIERELHLRGALSLERLRHLVFIIEACEPRATTH